MRRSVLLTLAALGGIVCLVGGVGLFSALTDTARTGTNSAESRALGASADIQLASASVPAGGTSIACGQFSENLATGFFSVSNVGPGFSNQQTYFCIRNVGSQSVLLSARTDELTDVELACTGDEELNGDTTCGAGQAGELADALWVEYFQHVGCDETGTSWGNNFSLRENTTTPDSLLSPGELLGPGGQRCFSVMLFYPDAGPLLAQRAQSDRVTWRFRFDAQA